MTRKEFYTLLPGTVLTFNDVSANETVLVVEHIKNVWLIDFNADWSYKHEDQTLIHKVVLSKNQKDDNLDYYINSHKIDIL